MPSTTHHIPAAIPVAQEKLDRKNAEELGRWFDDQLARLEARFADFVTVESTSAGELNGRERRS